MRAPAIRTPTPSPAGHAVTPKHPEGTHRASLVDRRPQAVAQRKLAQFVQNSPRVTAQAERHAALLGTPVAQRQSRHPLVLQAKAAGNDSAVGMDRAAEAMGDRATTVSGRAPREASPAPREGRGSSTKSSGCGCAPEKPAQLKAAAQRPGQASQKPIQKTPARNRTGLPDGLKAGVESLSGQDLSDVKVHTNSDKPAQLNALAYAQGNNIHLGPGQERHLPHEAWHLAQQKQGRVQPTTQLKGEIPVNDDQGLEHEADVMGAKAALMHRQ